MDDAELVSSPSPLDITVSSDATTEAKFVSWMRTRRVGGQQML